MEALINKVKLALRIVTNDFDSQIEDLVNACLLDLGIAGVLTPVVTTTGISDQLIIMAVTTYCKIHFGDANGVEEIDRLKRSYDEQKAQLQMATGYTTWL